MHTLQKQKTETSVDFFLLVKTLKLFMSMLLQIKASARCCKCEYQVRSVKTLKLLWAQIKKSDNRGKKNRHQSSTVLFQLTCACDRLRLCCFLPYSEIHKLTTNNTCKFSVSHRDTVSFILKLEQYTELLTCVCMTSLPISWRIPSCNSINLKYKFSVSYCSTFY